MRCLVMGYLKNDIIKGIQYKYEGGKLSVESDSTLFVGIQKMEYHGIEEFKKLYKEIKTLAKATGVKITNHKRMKEVYASFEEYTKLVAWQNGQVDELARLWYKKITDYPIRYGCSMDKGLGYLHKRADKVEQLYYTTSLTDQVNRTYRRLKDIKEQLVEQIECKNRYTLYGKLISCNII